MKCGHLAVGLWVDRPASSVNIGVGPPLFQFQHRSVRVRVHLLPIIGSVIFCWPSRNGWRNIAISLGGPAANIAVAAMLTA